jgi:putative membrane protein
VVELLLLLGAAAVYGAGVTRAWDAAGTGRLIRRSQVASFAAGLAAIGVALVSPLDGMAEHSLTAHMIQHVMLIAIAAPLVVVGAPVLAAGHAFGATPSHVPSLRHLEYRPRPATRRWALWIGLALATHVAAVALWHLPGAYDAALHNNAVHAAEHACFFLTAAALWWAALGAGRRSRRGAGLLVLFVATLPANALGLLMTIAATPWYPAYRHGSLAASLQDQQVAGVVMWGFGGVAALVGGCALFISWLESLDRATPGRGTVTSGPGTVATRPELG